MIDKDIKEENSLNKCYLIAGIVSAVVSIISLILFLIQYFIPREDLISFFYTPLGQCITSIFVIFIILFSIFSTIQWQKQSKERKRVEEELQQMKEKYNKMVMEDKIQQQQQQQQQKRNEEIQETIDKGLLEILNRQLDRSRNPNKYINTYKG